MRPTKATLYVRLNNNEPDHSVTPSDLREFGLVDGKKTFLNMRTLLESALSESNGSGQTNPEVAAMIEVMSLLLWKNPVLDSPSTMEEIKEVTTKLATVLRENREARATAQAIS